MNLTGLHLLLTFQCCLECDHCFVWGSPRQTGTLTLPQIREILQGAKDLGTINSIYFEGGEPFLYYTTLLEGVRLASGMGFAVGIVSNGYWATSEEDARVCLAPFAGLVQDLSISSDKYHWNEQFSRQAQRARSAAGHLGIPLGLISIAPLMDRVELQGIGQLQPGESAVRFRGRAAAKLASQAPQRSWREFTTCPHEDLRDPGRLHVDPFGNLHVCHGISLGNLFAIPLHKIIAAYDPEIHPITGPILKGGPAALVDRYSLDHQAAYADACHLCDGARRALRAQFPEILTPNQMYGVG